MKCELCQNRATENNRLRADINEILDALEDISPYVFAFQNQKRASAKIKHAAAILEKHRQAPEKAHNDQ
jgi:hypothetical protein